MKTLIVSYNGGICPEFDKKVVSVLEEIGCQYTTKGICTLTGERDICFTFEFPVGDVVHLESLPYN
jgi:hypothetical protein